MSIYPRWRHWITLRPGPLRGQNRSFVRSQGKQCSTTFSVPLGSLLPRKTATQGQAQVAMSRKQRFGIAAAIAWGVLHLCGSPWVKEIFDKNDILVSRNSNAKMDVNDDNPANITHLLCTTYFFQDRLHLDQPTAFTALQSGTKLSLPWEFSSSSSVSTTPSKTSGRSGFKAPAQTPHQPQSVVHSTYCAGITELQRKLCRAQ